MSAHSCTMHPEVVEEVSKRMVRGETLMKMSAFLKVVADPTRLSIVSALLIREMCVCDLASEAARHGALRGLPSACGAEKERHREGAPRG